MTISFRDLASDDIQHAVRLWQACALTRPWNDPVLDAQKAIEGPTSTIVGSFADRSLIGTAMCGWDGHRGWIYYLAVDPEFRRWGVGRKLIAQCEVWLGQFGAPKIQLMVRSDNRDGSNFYNAIGYDEEEFRIFCRRVPAKLHREQQSEAP